MTTRRGFLKGLMAAPAVVAAPVLAPKASAAQQASGPVLIPITGPFELGGGGGGYVYAQMAQGFGLNQAKIEGGTVQYDPEG